MSVRDAEKIKRDVVPYIVRIAANWKNGNQEEIGFGASGVFYQHDGRNVILTAGHVIDELKNAMEKDNSDARITLQIPELEMITIDCIKDVYEGLRSNECFLCVHDEYDRETKKNDVGFLEIFSQSLTLQKDNIRMVSHMELGKTDEELFITGFPQNNSGRKEAIPLSNPKRIFIDSEDYLDFSYTPPSYAMDRDDFMVGYSGSGVFAEYRGNIVLVGLVSNAPGDEKDQRYEERAISVKVIQAFLKKYQLACLRDDILPNYDEAIEGIKNEYNANICECLDCNFEKLKNSCRNNEIDDNAVLKILKEQLGSDLQKEQGFLFCGIEEYPCQTYWNKRLLWSLVMLSLVEKHPNNWEKIQLQLENDTVYGEFLCAEEKLYDLVRQMVKGYDANRIAENTVFFWNSKAEYQNETRYIRKKIINNIIEDIRKKGNYEERLKVKKQFFDITNGDERAEWAFISINELRDLICNSMDEKEMISNILDFLQRNVWN